MLEEVIAKHKELKQEGKTMAEVVAMMNGLSMSGDEMNEDTNQLIKLIEDFEIVEKKLIIIVIKLLRGKYLNKLLKVMMMMMKRIHV